MAGSSSVTALAMSTVLPLEALLMEMPIDDLPLVRVTAVSGAGAMRTSAIWPRVTGRPAALAPVAPPTDVAALMAVASAGAITSFSMASTVCARALTVIGYTRLPEVTAPAPVVRLACWLVVAICTGETPRRATSAALSWIYSCICSTPERVTAWTPGIPWSRGVTWAPTCVASF